VGCTQLGCAEIHIVGRNVQKLSQFQQSWVNAPLPITLNVHRWEELPELLPQADLVVNSTPVGMYPNVEQSPLDAAAMQLLQPGAIAYDLIYTPNPDAVFETSQRTGCSCDRWVGNAGAARRGCFENLGRTNTACRYYAPIFAAAFGFIDLRFVGKYHPLN
jgi:shikimate 5-dehydrogenase